MSQSNRASNGWERRGRKARAEIIHFYLSDGTQPHRAQRAGKEGGRDSLRVEKHSPNGSGDRGEGVWMDAPHSTEHSLVGSIVTKRITLQRPAKRWATGCVNAAAKARQKWKATAGTKFTKSWSRLLAGSCTSPGMNKVCLPKLRQVCNSRNLGATF